MGLKNKIIGRLAIHQSACYYKESSKTVKTDIQAMIDDAWENNDLAVKRRQRELFPYGKPSPDEFIAVMAAEVKKQKNH